MTGGKIDPSGDPLNLLRRRATTSRDRIGIITDLLSAGHTGDIHFTALLPPHSPMIPKHLQRAGNSGIAPAVFSRGYKETGHMTCGRSQHTRPDIIIFSWQV